MNFHTCSFALGSNCLIDGLQPCKCTECMPQWEQNSFKFAVYLRGKQNLYHPKTSFVIVMIVLYLLLLFVDLLILLGNFFLNFCGNFCCDLFYDFCEKFCCNILGHIYDQRCCIVQKVGGPGVIWRA